MRRIFKYPLNTSTSRIEMPAGAQILCVQTQAGIPTVWALVDDERHLEVRNFLIIGTGHEVPSNAVYVGTWQAPPFVWHLFKEGL